MPELAEVEMSRRIWDAGRDDRIDRVELNAKNRIFRGASLPTLRRELPESFLKTSLARGKQMIFEFARTKGGPAHFWLGIHLGMAGDLRVDSVTHPRGKHDQLILRQRTRALVFRDVRHFGRVRVHAGDEAPAWWTSLPPDLTSAAFTKKVLDEFLERRKRAPIKAVLLMQQRFPGIGNWMADEILWRARIHPRTSAGSIAPKSRPILWREIRGVCRDSLRVMDDHWNYPDSWLFRHRWKRGGSCPRCGTDLNHATIGGRTTCWCPRCQQG